MIAVLVAKISSTEPLIATKTASDAPENWPARSESSWLTLAVLLGSGTSVVDHRVKSGLVRVIVKMTSAIVRYATVRRGERIAGAIWATLSRPENARNAAPNPVITTSGVSGGGPRPMAAKLCTTPAGPRWIATMTTTSN